MQKNHDDMAVSKSKKSNTIPVKRSAEKLEALARDMRSGNYFKMAGLTREGNRHVMMPNRKIYTQITAHQRNKE